MKNYYVIFYNTNFYDRPGKTLETRVDIYYVEKTNNIIGFDLVCFQGCIIRYSPNKIHPIPYKRLLKEMKDGQGMVIYQNRVQEEVEEYLYKILVQRVKEGKIVKIYEGE